MPRRWDTAQTCLSGHVITARADSDPGERENFCSTCGSQTITQCPRCHYAIRGVDLTSMVAVPCFVPAYCKHCGAAFPWTESRLRAAQSLVEESEDLSGREREVAVHSTGEMAQDTPAAAAERLSKIVGNVAPKVRALIMEWTVELASETASKMLMGSDAQWRGA